MQKILNPRRRPGQMDYTLLVLTFILILFGLVMMYSASGIYADQRYHTPYYFVQRQLAWLALGIPAMMLFSRMDYNRLRGYIWPSIYFTAAALTAALFSHAVGGARRWVRLGPVGFQPAEAAKLVMILYLADYLDRKHSKLDSVVHGLLAPWTFPLILMGLIALEPDLGTPALMAGVAVLLFFIGGARMKYLFGSVACAVPILIYELFKYSYRRQRLLQFLHPWSNARGAGYQLVQSLIAAGSGGWLGKGLGASELKLMYLPAPHTDFIFPIIAEELGWVGSVMLLFLFGYLLTRGMLAAKKAPNLFGTLLGAGISLLITSQAFFNIGMSIGLLPTKGVPLPFFSFGGSSLLMTLAGIGIVLNISRQGKP